LEVALTSLARAMGGAPAVDATRRSQLSTIRALCDAKSCYVVEFVPTKNLLEVCAVSGRNDSRIRAAAVSEGAVGRAFAQLSVCEEDETRAIPLVGPRGPWGCLALIAPKRALSPTAFEAVAAQLSAGWEFARLYDESVRHNKDLQTAVSGLKTLEKSREEMLFHVSHDLKNPLTAIKGHLAMLARGTLGELSSKQIRALEGCERSANRLAKMIADLLLISRLEAGEMELHERPFGMKALAEEVIHALAAVSDQARVKIILRKSPELFVQGDRARLFEAISKLLEYSVHSAMSQSQIELSLASTGSGTAALGARVAGLKMDSQGLSTLFDAYGVQRNEGSRSRREGGLALPIASKIVHLHGGRIWAEPDGEGGTRFWINLPLFAGVVQPTPGELEPRLGGILLVEDDFDCREVLQQVLEHEGYRVTSTGTATEAKSLLADLRVALVLLDLRLPDEDGREVLHFIRQHPTLADVPVFLISGASEVASLASGQGIDRIDGVFEKPLRLPELLDTVAQAVEPVRQRASPGS
jgi:signal transduction histidine kinase/CheY-like chemotaxis protein